MSNSSINDENEKTMITVETTINRAVDVVWKCFTEPEHIMQWNFASDDWHCPSAVNDLEEGKSFKYKMASRNGSASFDFEGVYDQIENHRHITFTLLDSRVVTIDFLDFGHSTRVVERFEAEETFPIEYQRDGWQAILDNLKKHTELTDLQ